MSESEIKVSVIVPVYNVENYIGACLDSLVKQTIDKNEIEVLLINDGSTDNSEKICEEYANNFPFINLYSKENGGPAKARNLALELAKGKYIAYLDSDDRLSENVLKTTTDFFDNHYDEIDEVTYKIVPIEAGVRKKTHYRYDIMNKTGIYDLRDEKNIYITQTNMNIVVKNMGDENVFFDTTPNYRHEDQQYSTDILRKKWKIGFVSGCEYYYENNPESIVSEFYSATLFDITVEKWEEMFNSFPDKLPKYIQALYVNDIQWKMKADILLPYHLSGKAYDAAVDRLKKLLKRVDNDVILNHPDCAEMNKYYFISMKYDNELNAEFSDKIRLVHGDELIYETDSINLVITRFKPHGDELEVCGHLSSPVFEYCAKPELFIQTKDGLESLELTDSSWCYDNAKVKNNQAWGFRKVFDISRSETFAFKIEIGANSYEVNLITGEWVVFNKKIGRMEYVMNGKEFIMTENRFDIEIVNPNTEIKYKLKSLLKYLKSNRKVFAVRLMNILKPKKRIWLYHDCKGVGKDNGYYQFINDFYKNDGIERYYVVNGSIDSVKDWFDKRQQKYIVEFRSAKHKLMYLNAEKILTAFIEKVNYLPFFDDVYKYYIDLFSGEVTYLQHGVLHAHLPWKYAYDRLDLNYEVVSTEYEVKNFTENYCFPKSSLICSKMPRYDFIDTDSKPDSNRILLAPSWRKYLVSMKGDGEWVSTPEKFVKSDYYIRTQEFLNSDALEELLVENDWYLDFKPHPIFARYNDCFKINNERVKLVDEINRNDYKICITDFSSFVFDFVYLNRAIVYFLPDYKQFSAGMNDYKKLDLPFEKGFGEFAVTSEEVVEAISRIIKNDGKSIPPFDERNSNFFFNKEKNCREQIYNTLKN
jgi:glycosyltransferase involved in cell wall biosynthesis